MRARTLATLLKKPCLDLECAPVITVTNTNPSGPGSLQEAMLTAGDKKIEFAVSGSIDISASLIGNGNTLIAGETAPFPGITIRKASGVSTVQGLIRLTNSTGDSVSRFKMRHIRLRAGGGEVDKSVTFWVNAGHNIEVEHCDLGYCFDDIAKLFIQVDGDTLYNVKFRYCIFGPAFTDGGHGTGFNAGGLQDAEAEPPVFWDTRVHDVTIERCLFVLSTHRNWRYGALRGRFINNAVYGWVSRVGEGHRACEMDIIGNMFKRGPNSTTVTFRYDTYEGDEQAVFGAPDPSIYWSGNEAMNIDGSPFTPSIVIFDQTDPLNRHYTELLANEVYGRAEPLVNEPVLTAAEAWADVLANAGAWNDGQRDTISETLVQYAANGTGANPANYADLPDELKLSGGYTP